MYRVKDYKFETEAEAKEAQSELRAVDYLRTKVNMDQPEAALEIFRQLIDQDIFHTIVGYDFLKSLQNFLRSSSAINNADIPQIPDALAQSVLPKIAGQPAAKSKGEEPAVPKEPAAKAPEQETAKKKPADAPEAEERKEVQQPAAKPAKKDRKRRERQPKEKKEKKPRTRPADGGAGSDRYRRLAVTFGVTTAVLLVAVIAMFAITLTSDNPTILDYETKLLNKYSSWEEDLSRKETELKNREADIEFREQALRNQTFAPVEEYEDVPPMPPEGTALEDIPPEETVPEESAQEVIPEDAVQENASGDGAQ